MLIKNRADIIASVLLLLMVGSAVLSLKDDSATSDEVAHIIAGYSYLVKQDYRLNPEHPPLLKDLAAVPLLLIGLHFPDDSHYWVDEVNGQWGLGRIFLYHSGHDANQILFWSRIPTVVLMFLLGLYVYKWSKGLYGSDAALLALALYSFSPNVLAHGRFVTTDLGVTFFVFVSFYYFWKFLEKPTRLHFALATLSFTLAQLSKFSAILLVPVFLLLVLLKRRFLKHLALLLLSCCLIVGVYYQLHLTRMPLAVQHRLIDASLIDESQVYEKEAQHARAFLHGLADVSLLRPYGQYLLGFFMAGSHAIGGHTSFFMGEIGRHHWYYYPVVYMIKEPLASQILLLAAIGLALKRRCRPQPLVIGVLAYCFLHLAVFSCFKLQLGIRHVLPLFPFVYMLTAGQIVKTRAPALRLLVVWLAISSLLVFPSYLAYYNELVGGPRNGYRYVVNSNTDWGQDLKRLAQFVRENGIERIKVDYFGGGDPAYYLVDRFVYWRASRGPTEGWLAVGASPYQWYREDYAWLAEYTPVAQIGYSIFVYNISR